MLYNLTYIPRGFRDTVTVSAPAICECLHATARLQAQKNHTLRESINHAVIPIMVILAISSLLSIRKDGKLIVPSL